MILNTYNLPQAHRDASQCTIDCFGMTDRGLVREVNEDQFLVGELSKALRVHHTSLGVDESTQLGGPQGQLLLVADGLGGHASGERASTIAVDRLSQFAVNAMHWCARLDDCDDEQVFAEWRKALKECDAAVHAEGEQLPQRRGMGTTLTMAYIAWPSAFVLHAGDSRCYLLRREQLTRVTTDHTVAQKFVEAGVLPPEQAGNSRFSHVLWNAIGGSDDGVVVEAHKLGLQLGDVLLLCTDGLTKEISEDKIAEMLVNSDDSAESCQRLIEAANGAGGGDNTTVVVARFTSQKHEANGRRKPEVA
ncbi:MAG TPA: protein phosphatase 2C domain-containing protein [Pirellulales bacterium]|nr:protein phosphatase 2C domain-containing protein [Pirellulales bacterium]